MTLVIVVPNTSYRRLEKSLVLSRSNRWSA